MTNSIWLQIDLDYFSNNGISVGFAALSTIPGQPEALLILGGVSMDFKTVSSSVYILNDEGCQSLQDLQLVTKKPSPDYFLDNQCI